MQQPEVDNNNITVLGHSEGTVVSHKVAIDNPDKVKDMVLMGALAQNMSEILEFQVVNLPLLYAEQVLDTNHNGLLSVQEALKEVNFQRMIGGNISLILTQQNVENGKVFYPSTQWQTQQGPIQQYVLRDLYSWLEVHSKFTFLSIN